MEEAGGASQPVGEAEQGCAAEDMVIVQGKKMRCGVFRPLSTRIALIAGEAIGAVQSGLSMRIPRAQYIPIAEVLIDLQIPLVVVGFGGAVREVIEVGVVFSCGIPAAIDAI